MTGPHPDRLFPADARLRSIARSLYEAIATLPIVSPHGHCDPAWFAGDVQFPDPATLFIIPDHYLFRMLYSQGVPLSDLGVVRVDGGAVETDKRKIWRRLADHWHLFLGTPSRLWLEYVLADLFGLTDPLGPANADHYFDVIDARMRQTDFSARALFKRFNIEVLATTDAATDDLSHHRALSSSGWSGRIIPTFRPDALTDPHHESFRTGMAMLADQTGEDVESWNGYLAAIRKRRQFFIDHGATATDHGVETPLTLDLTRTEVGSLFTGALRGKLDAGQAARFQAHMLVEMARMSRDDGLVMQIHAGSSRNHNQPLFEIHGRDVGADIPRATNWVDGLKPLLNAVGTDPAFRLLVFTLDESTYARELAPLAGHYPCMRLGPPWWFHDSAAGIQRFLDQVIETAGFYNLAGFNDDTRAFLSIPGRHDVWRRGTASFLARLVGEHQLTEAQAIDLAELLAVNLARDAYRLT